MEIQEHEQKQGAWIGRRVLWRRTRKMWIRDEGRRSQGGALMDPLGWNLGADIAGQEVLDKSAGFSG